MRKRNLQKAVVLMICLAFLGLSASGLSAAPAKSAKVSISMLFSHPIQYLVSVFPGLKSIFGDPSSQPAQTTDGTTQIIKQTGTIKSVKLSTKD